MATRPRRDAAEVVARLFLQRKGYRNLAEPEVSELDEDGWLFIYDLPEGEVELEVRHDGRRWSWRHTFWHDSQIRE